MTGAADGGDAPFAADERAALIAAHERRVDALRSSYDYVAVRRADPRTHSWTISVNEYRTGTVRVAAGLALDRTMV